MEPHPSVYIVVLNWNGWRDTIRCLDSVRRLDYPASHILAVDNGSVDGSAQRISAAHPEVELIETGKNLGFAGGNNIAIREALERGAEYIWVVNNDAEVEPETLSALFASARSHARVGIVAPSVWRPGKNGEPARETGAFQWRGEYRLPATCPPTDGRTGEPFHLVDDVAGSGPLLDAKMLREIGLFDERFFHYWEDVELCVRARQAGWLVAHACGARIWHTAGGSVPTESPQAQYYFVRNWLHFSHWTGRGNLLTMFRRAPRMTLGRIFGRRWLVQGRWRVSVAALLGVVDALRGRYGQRDLPRWLG
jgi:GT2 family glycosyltransferase